MTIANLTARRLQIFIGSDQQDWSAHYGTFIVGYESLNDETEPGKIPITGQLEIKPAYNTPESIDPLTNPTRWRVGQDVYIQTRNDANNAWLDTPYSRLKIVAQPSRPGRGSLFLDLGCKVLWSNQSKFDDDRSGIIYGQAETADAVAQRLLEASDIATADISLTTWPYSLDRPIGKRGQNSYLNQVADLAYANDWRYLHQNSSGQVVATELSLASTGAIATVTRGQNDLVYEPNPDPERPAEVTKVSGLGYELGTIENPSVDVEDTTGDFNDLSPNSFGEGVFTRTITTESFTTGASPSRTKRVQIFKAEALMFQNPSVPSQLREFSDEVETLYFETGKTDPTTARLTRCIRTKLQNGRTLDPADEVFNMREIERDQEDITYGSSEPMTRYQLSSTQAAVILDENATDKWEKITVEALDFNWTEHTTGKFDRKDKTTEPLIRLRSNIDRELAKTTALTTKIRNYNRSRPNTPFDTVYFDAGIDEGESEFTGESAYIPPGGPAGYEKERGYTVANGMAFNNAQMATLATKHRDLAIGHERGYTIELQINDALLQSPPLPEIDVVDTDSLTYTYKGDALTFEFTQSRATAGCVGIWVGGGYAATVNVVAIIPRSTLVPEIAQTSFAVAAEVPSPNLFPVVSEGIVITATIPQPTLVPDVSVTLSVAATIPQPTLVPSTTLILVVNANISQPTLIPDVSTLLVVNATIPQPILTPDVSVDGVLFSNVQLLLHMEGTNGSTTFTDNSSAARTPTVNSGATITTAQFKYGSASGDFDGGTSSLEYADSADFTASGDFCFEMFVRGTDWASTDGGANRALLTLGNSLTASAPGLLLDTGGEVLLFNGSTRITSAAMSLNTWHHVAWYRVSGIHYIAIDGVVDSETYSNSTEINPALLRIGASISNVGNFEGQIDEVRYVVDESPYDASNFTPPTGPHPDS